MTRRLVILAMLAVVVVVLQGCGRKGPLQPPPASSMLPAEGDVVSV